MSRKKQVNQKITALYCRISLEDGGDNESMSISNQKLMPRDFAEKNGMFQYEYYVDDGYTGRNFNRPSFQRMIADIEAGKIGCVITKDLFRLGRNYIEAGSYIEIFFPKHRVRYIAITDGVDSLTRQEMDITPFKNILNDMYSRDISKKVLAGRMTRSRQGKFCVGQPPLGLMRDPEDNGHLILDPDTAPVIRKIYDMALDGLGCMRIAKQLMEDKIPITRVKGDTACDVNYYSWGASRISHILRNPFYKGAHLVCRTHQKGIRSNTYDIIPRGDWEPVVQSLKISTRDNEPSPTPDKHTGKRLSRIINSGGDAEYAAFGETLWYYKYHYTTAQMELSNGTVKTTSGRQWGDNATKATSPYYLPGLFENTEARTYWGS